MNECSERREDYWVKGVICNESCFCMFNMNVISVNTRP